MPEQTKNAAVSGEWKLVPVAQLKKWHRDMDACQKVMWLRGGFDPAYCMDAQDCLKQMDVALSDPVPPADGPVEVLAVGTLGSFSAEELGEIDIEPQMKTLERIQQQVVTNEDVSLELVDRAHVTRLQAENSALQQSLTIADQRVDDLQSVVEQVLTNAERGLPPDLHRTLRKLVPEPASTQPVDEAEREPFEAWHRRRFKTKYSTGAPTRDIHGSVPDPNYGPPNQQQMWEAWNARAALLMPRDNEIPGTSFQRLNALANEGE